MAAGMQWSQSPLTLSGSHSFQSKICLGVLQCCFQLHVMLLRSADVCAASKRLCGAVHMHGVRKLGVFVSDAFDARVQTHASLRRSLVRKTFHTRFPSCQPAGQGSSVCSLTQTVKLQSEVLHMVQRVLTRHYAAAGAGLQAGGATAMGKLPVEGPSARAGGMSGEDGLQGGSMQVAATANLRAHMHLYIYNKDETSLPLLVDGRGTWNPQSSQLSCNGPLLDWQKLQQTQQQP